MAINLLTDDVTYANVRSKWALSSGNLSTDFNPLHFDIPNSEFTTIGTWANTDGNITIPADGTYHISCAIEGSANFPGTGTLVVQVGGVLKAQLFKVSTNEFYAGGDCYLDLSAGDVLNIRFATTGSSTLDTGETQSFLSITRVADYSAGQPVGFGLATDTQYGLVKKNAATSTVSGVVGGTNGIAIPAGQIGEELSDNTASITTLTTISGATTGQSLDASITLDAGVYLMGYIVHHEVDINEQAYIWVRSDTTNDAVNNSIIRSVAPNSGTSEGFRPVSTTFTVNVTTSTTYHLVGVAYGSNTRIFGWTNTNSSVTIQGTGGQDQTGRLWAVRIG